jgi:hypothetical protein
VPVTVTQLAGSMVKSEPESPGLPPPPAAQAARDSEAAGQAEAVHLKLPARHGHRDESRSLPGTVLPVRCRGGLSATVSPAPGRPPAPRRATPGIRWMIIMPVTGLGPGGTGPRIASSSQVSSFENLKLEFLKLET